MPKARIQLIETKCEKCGKPLVTTSRSLHGLDALKAATPILCAGCATVETLWDINYAIGRGITAVVGQRRTR